MRQHGGVPADFEEFVQKYSRMVYWAIHRVSRGRAHPDDIEDLAQMVYLRVWQKDYLNRCRQLIAERGTGQFSTFVYWIVRSVLVNQFRVNGREPANRPYHLLDPREKLPKGTRLPKTISTTSSQLKEHFSDLDFEDRLHADLGLEQFATYISTTRRGAELVRTLELLYAGYTAREIAAQTGLPQSRVVSARRDLKARHKAYRSA